MRRLKAVMEVLPVTQKLTESGGSAGHFDDLLLGSQVPEKVYADIGLAAVSTGGT
jgi:hypothetical protein